MPKSRRPRHPRQSAAFTLVELLVVIGIIVVLIGILLPVINNVKKGARRADTLNQIAQLTALINAYQADFKAYPGPIPNHQLRGAQTAPSANNITVPMMIANKITMAENLYLGLMGGLEPGMGSTPAMPTFAYNKQIAGTGPRWLGTTPKKLPPYGDNSEITRRADLNFEGDFRDEVADCDDSTVPEYLDRFPDGLPILYLRARPGVVTMPGDPIVSATPSLPATAQYDLTQVSPYTGSDMTGYIGVGKENDGTLRKNPDITDTGTPAYYHHGFRTADAPDVNAVTNPAAMAPATYSYPYNIVAALRHPTLANTPKQKDGFILISAGIDRVYGTQDDITNFGQY